MALVILTLVTVASSTFARASGVLVGVALALTFLAIWANREAERRLLPRFEKDFRLLGRTQKVAATISVMLLVVLSLVAFLLTAQAARDKLAGS